MIKLHGRDEDMPLSNTVEVPRDLLAQVIRSLDRNVLERPSRDEFIPTAPHACDEDCTDVFDHDGSWVTTFEPHPLAQRLRDLLAPSPEPPP